MTEGFVNMNVIYAEHGDELFLDLNAGVISVTVMEYRASGCKAIGILVEDDRAFVFNELEIREIASTTDEPLREQRLEHTLHSLKTL